MKESECVKGQAFAQAPELEEAGMSGLRAEVPANSKTAILAHDFSLRQHHSSGTSSDHQLPAGFLSNPGHDLSCTNQSRPVLISVPHLLCLRPVIYSTAFRIQV